MSFFAGDFQKGGSSVMSYHANKSMGQRSFGLIFVVVFHIILIYGLASGLASDVSNKVAEVLQTKVVEEEKLEEIVEPPPPPPDTKVPPPDHVPLPTLDFMPDAPAATAIKAVVREAPKVESTAAVTRPKPAGKGLSQAEYPAASVRLGEEGVVGLSMNIAETGRVTEATITKSSGFERLDEAARKHAERAWKFIPCMQGDKPVACVHQMNVRMKIENAK